MLYKRDPSHSPMGIGFYSPNSATPSNRVPNSDHYQQHPRSYHQLTNPKRTDTFSIMSNTAHELSYCRRCKAHMPGSHCTDPNAAHGASARSGSSTSQSSNSSTSSSSSSVPSMRWEGATLGQYRQTGDRKTPLTPPASPKK